MASPTGYNILGYGNMITSEPRMSAYAEALREAVTPGCTVFDIGAGPCIFSVLACNFGAGAVVAIEPDDVIELGRQIAAANGCADRVTFFQGLSTAFQPAAPADVIVSDIRGGLPLFEGHIPAIVDARERLLRPGGTLIPARDIIRIALAENAEAYAPHERPWLENRFDLDLSSGHRFAANVRTKASMTPVNLLSDPQDLLVLDYRSVTETDADCSVSLVAKRPGTAHGLHLWFDAELADGIGFSNAPGEPEQIYGQNFFPLERPVELVEGDCVQIEISARLIDGSYIWSWNSDVLRKGSQAIERSFRQSSFRGKVMSPSSLQRRAGTFVPPLAREHEIDQYCLSLIDGVRDLGKIAESLRSHIPERFESSGEALDYVTRLTQRYL